MSAGQRARSDAPTIAIDFARKTLSGERKPGLSAATMFHSLEFYLGSDWNCLPDHRNMERKIFTHSSIWLSLSSGVKNSPVKFFPSGTSEGSLGFTLGCTGK